MLYQIYETQRSIMEPFADLAQAAAKMYSNPLNPMGNSPLAQRVSASYELMHRLGKDYVKPEFGLRTVQVGKVDVAIHERIEINKPFCELRRFKRFSDDAATLDKLKTQPGRKIIFIIWAGGNPFKIADMDLKRYGIEIATGGNILPAMVAYKQFPGMEGAAYYYFGMPKNTVNDAMVARHYTQFKSPPDFFTAGGFASAMALVTALKKTNGNTDANTLISTMEGMSFDTPKGKMTFRKEDHQAMQSMYHFKIKVDPAFAWGVPELIREIKPEEMNVPIRNKR